MLYAAAVVLGCCVDIEKVRCGFWWLKTLNCGLRYNAFYSTLNVKTTDGASNIMRNSLPPEMF